MNRDSRQTIHMGINFIFSPMVTIDRRSYIAFQNALLEEGIEITKTALQEQREIALTRDMPTDLEIKVSALGPPAIGQLLIVAPHPSRDLNLFIQEIEAVLRAFDATWPEQNRQLMRSDATLRDLFETDADHAFQELWETRLKQSQESLAAFGRPVLGGGLRFVMPPVAGEPRPVQIEVKIESFLRDTKKMFVETQFTWPSPMPAGTTFDPAFRLHQVDDYIEQQVLSFILGGIP
ncbi:MAG TPA: hypothetical protein VJ793_03185 [Anaerolineae bacterium]|nr:hypothetical protein [Anaerolineae bacterium]